MTIMENSEKIATHLNTLLTDEYVFYIKTRNSRWNIGTSSSSELNQFLEIQYKVLDEMIDDIAQRIRSLGHLAFGPLKDFTNATHMIEENLDFSDSAQIIQTMVIDQEKIIRMIQLNILPISKKNNDLDTANLASGLIEQHKKMVWMQKSFLSEPDFSAITHIRNIADTHSLNQSKMEEKTLVNGNWKEDKVQLESTIESLKKDMAEYKKARKSGWKTVKDKFKDEVKNAEESLKNLLAIHKKEKKAAKHENNIKV